jgi:hypothetical protein
MPSKIMKKINLSLFIVGTLLTVVGFLLASTDNYPFVLKIVSPAYVNGMKGIKILESGKDLKPGMVGFKEIALPLSRRLKNPQTNEKLSGCVIAIIKWPTSIGQEFRTSGVKTVRKVRAECEDGTPVDTTMESLTKNVAKLKVRNLKRYSLIIFLVGLACSFISFFVETKKSA